MGFPMVAVQQACLDLGLMETVAVIGGSAAGLTCARRLIDAGYAVVGFEKAALTLTAVSSVWRAS